MRLYIPIKLPRFSLRLSLAALIAAGALVLADPSVFTLMTFAAALLHELGHMVALYLCGAHIYGVTVLPFGAVIRSDAERLSYKREALCAAAGPLAGLTAALASGLLCAIFHDRYSLFFCACNLTLSGINLLPVQSLDGWRMVRALLYEFVPFEQAQGLLDGIADVSLGLLTFAALALVLLGSCNLSLILFCICLFLSPDRCVMHPYRVNSSEKS